MSKPQHIIYSIFGDCEALAANEMRFTKISPLDIPPSALYNAHGQRARFAVVVPRSQVQKFENLILDYRM